MNLFSQIPLPTEQKLWDAVLDKGLTIILLAVAVYFAIKFAMKERQDSNELRTAVITEMKGRINTLEARARDCEEDRRHLHEEISGLKKP